MNAVASAATLAVGLVALVAPASAQRSATTPNVAAAPVAELSRPVPLAPALRRAFEGRPVGARWPRALLGQAASAAVAAPTARERFGRTGLGAAVCVIDTGLDLAHRDFLDAAGRTRVRWLLDRGAPERGEHAGLEADFGGAVWSGDDIDAARAVAGAVPRDVHGHGTAVASLAVGDDAGRGELGFGVDAGVAPEASLVIARLPVRGGFADEDVIAGVRFCLAVADEGPAPVGVDRTVIVLGLGGHDGAHDGSEPLERELTASSRGGAHIVVAAGNGGDRAEHAAVSLSPGRGAELPFFLPPVLGPPAPAHLSLVVVGPAAASWTVGTRAPDGTELSTVSVGGTDAALHDGGRLTVDASRPAEAGSRRVYVVASGGEGEAPELGGGTYAVLVSNDGPDPISIDAWLVEADLGSTLGRPAFQGELATSAGTVTVPATADGVVSVGATVTSDAVLTELAMLAGDGPAGSVAPWSARGPDRRAAPRPLVVAPGGWSVAALSSDIDAATSGFGLPAVLEARRVGASRVAVRGTSFAAPLVAGALALALEGEASRGADDVALLAATAAGQAQPWSPSSGAGALDVAAFLEARSEGLAAPGANAPEVAATLSRVAPGQDTVWLALRWLDSTGRPALGDVVVEGPEGATPVRVPGYAAVEVPLGRVDARAARLTVTSGGAGPTRLRIPGSGGGGCAAAGAPNARGAAWLPLLLAWLACARRR